MGFRDIQPDTNELSAIRMGSHEYRFTPVTHWGAAVNPTGNTLRLWLALPRANNPIPVLATLVTPISGYALTTTQVKFSLREDDLAAHNMNPGTYPGCLLISNDGGTTSDVLWIGNVVVYAGWITDTF